MMNANGFFFFKFNDEVGMLNVLKDGPWIIRSQPLFLNKWTPTTKLEKKEVKQVQIWVKIHEVPIAAYTEDGLSLIATTIGEPKMLDSFTTSMCTDSWGRSSYVRALVEISAEKELREEITMAIPEPDGEGYIKETMYVEYEWSPHRCATCCVFGHSNEMCPKKPIKSSNARQEDHNHNIQRNRQVKKLPNVDQDDYTFHGKKAARKIGIPVNKQKNKFEYRPVGSKSKPNEVNGSTSNALKSNNHFDILNKVDSEAGTSKKVTGGGLEETDDDEVEDVYNETDEFMVQGSLNLNSKQGACTPSPIVTDGSHVDVDKLGKVCRAVFRSWDWTSNGGCCDKDNYYVSRRELWHHLSMHKVLVAKRPWFIMGDFNFALNIEDKSMGTSSISIGMREFQACVDEIEVFDINRMGIHFTWNQKPKKGVGLLKKIDRVMGNTPFVDEYPNSVAMFKPNRLSDHCPCILSIPEAMKLKPRSFKFANFLVFKPEFLDIVKKHWETNVDGVHQFRVVKKLRFLKNPLRSLLFKQGNHHKKVERLRMRLDVIQKILIRTR
ncbi:uncharacterized protein LOC110944968 [Helianthus annuus]|uniref:uncharacterized protein LOC110944968 n=1 Tax=Helianthus annuus TaxID=4232 RepID=UPI000B8F24B3|nr:uncharacterized protein LOC110944968 [Helianthus annuus]